MAGTLLYGMEDDKAPIGGATAFITRLLNGAVTAHLHHLSTDSFAKHMALGSLYEELPGKVDALAEAFMGCTSQKMPSPGDPVADIEALYEFVEQARGQMGGESHIQNLVDEISDLLSSTLYKLKFLG